MTIENEVWTYTYEECGGYDSMTGAFVLFLGNRRIATIDQCNFGQKHCTYEKLPEVEALAKYMVEKLNDR